MGKPLIFIHLPKTGGKTMYELLDRKYGENKTMYIPIAQCGKAYEVIKATKGIDCFYGPFGYKRLNGFRYATIVRNPVGRVTSYYRWLQGKEEPQHPGAEIAKGTIEDFVMAGWHRVENAQTMQLAGFGMDPPRAATAIDLHDARDALKEIEHVGVTDKYDRLISILGLDTENVPRHNSTVSEKYSQPTIEEIRNRNKFDETIYQAAKIIAAGGTL